MKISIQSCSSTVTDILGDGALVNLKPRARVHHAYELALPEGTTKRVVPASRPGYYPHEEYTLPNGKVIVVTVLFSERYAYLK